MCTRRPRLVLLASLGALFSVSGLVVSAASAAEPEPFAVRLPPRGEDIRLMGWSADGKRFAVEVQRGYDLGDLGGIDYFSILEVRTTRGARLVDAYQGQRHLGDSSTDESATSEDRWSRAHRAARKTGKKAFLERLVPGRRGLASKDGAWTLGAEQIGTSSEVTLSLEPPKRLIRINVRADTDDDTFGEIDDSSGPKISVRIVARKGTETVSLGRVQIPKKFLGDPCGTAGQSKSTGGIAARWAPGEAHAFIQLWLNQETTNDECPGNTWSTYWVRPMPPATP